MNDIQYEKNDLFFIRDYIYSEGELIESITPVLIAAGLKYNFTNKQSIFKYKESLKDVYVLVYINNKYKLVNITTLIKKEDL